MTTKYHPLQKDVWLGHLVGNTAGSDGTFNIAMYGVFSAAIAIGVVIRGAGFSYSILRKSISLHDRVLKAILRAPISFYDTTAVGQVLAYFARHLYLIDDFLPEGWLQVLSFSPVLLGVIVLVSVIVPYFAATLPVYLLLAWIIVRRCKKVEERLKTMEGKKMESRELSSLLFDYEQLSLDLPS